MRHGKQTAALFFAAEMVMGGSPAVVFAEEMESGAEKQAAATGALAESELTSGEQECTEQTGEAVLPEDNLLSAGSAQEEPKKEIPQDKAESGITDNSPAVVFAEDLQSGAEQEAAATGALAESELTSGEQESTEQTGEAVLLEDNLLSAGSAQEKPEEGLLQDKAESGITDIPIISEWQGETEELWSWVYVEQEQKFTLDEAYVEVFKNHEIKWRWEPVEAKSESAVQLTLGADGGSCIVTGVKGHAGEKGRLVAEVFDEAGKQTGSAKSGQIEVREPSYKYDLQTYMSVPAVWEGDVPLRMVCIPEDADNPYRLRCGSQVINMIYRHICLSRQFGKAMCLCVWFVFRKMRTTLTVQKRFRWRLWTSRWIRTCLKYRGGKTDMYM